MTPCGIHEFNRPMRACPICEAVHAELAVESAIGGAKYRRSRGQWKKPPPPTHAKKVEHFEKVRARRRKVA